MVDGKRQVVGILQARTVINFLNGITFVFTLTRYLKYQPNSYLKVRLCTNPFVSHEYLRIQLRMTSISWKQPLIFLSGAHHVPHFIRHPTANICSNLSRKSTITIFSFNSPLAILCSWKIKLDVVWSIHFQFLNILFFITASCRALRLT